MRTFSIALVVLLICIAIYAYQNNPRGCVKLGDDLAVDLPAIFKYRGDPSTHTNTETEAPPPSSTPTTQDSTNTITPASTSAPHPAPVNGTE